MYSWIEDIADCIEEKVIEYRRDFHKYPEAGWTEYRTASIIARRLSDLGYEIRLGKEVINEKFRMGVPEEEVLENNYLRALKQGADVELIEKLRGGYTGVVATMKNGDGPVVALRFDMDALNVQESGKKEHLPFIEGFSSVNENVMHACGHDGHLSIGLGTAEVLSKLKNEIKGTLKLIFQPAEEGVRGARSMVEAGVLDDVDYLLGGHIGLKANSSGKIICGVGGFLAISQINAIFKGKASHAGAAPENGNNALLSAATAVLNLYSIPRNSSGATRINVGKLISGTERNVIPENAFLVLETRGETSELNDYMRKYAEKILLSAADMHGVEVEIINAGGSISADSDDDMLEMVKKAAQSIRYFDCICDEKINFGASEDITFMMDRVQSRGGKAIFMMVGSDLKADHHNSEFDFDEKNLKPAIELYSTLVYDILRNDYYLG